MTKEYRNLLTQVAPLLSKLAKDTQSLEFAQEQKMRDFETLCVKVDEKKKELESIDFSCKTRHTQMDATLDTIREELGKKMAEANKLKAEAERLCDKAKRDSDAARIAKEQYESMVNDLSKYKIQVESKRAAKVGI